MHPEGSGDALAPWFAVHMLLPQVVTRPLALQSTPVGGSHEHGPHARLSDTSA
jgi:hypothetical protein